MNSLQRISGLPEHCYLPETTLHFGTANQKYFCQSQKTKQIIEIKGESDFMVSSWICCKWQMDAEGEATVDEALLETVQTGIRTCLHVLSVSFFPWYNSHGWPLIVCLKHPVTCSGQPLPIQFSLKIYMSKNMQKKTFEALLCTFPAQSLQQSSFYCFYCSQMIHLQQN